jgi:hypothetical protein
VDSNLSSNLSTVEAVKPSVSVTRKETASGSGSVPRFSEKRAEAYKMLCRAMIHHYGGYTDLGKQVNASRQHVFVWHEQGFVDIIRVYSVAKILHVSPWALSFYKLAYITGDVTVDFPTVVKESPLMPGKKTEILKTYRAKR